MQEQTKECLFYVVHHITAAELPPKTYLFLHSWAVKYEIFM